MVCISRLAQIVRQYCLSGFAVIPLRLDGSKATKICWKVYDFEKDLLPFFSWNNGQGVKSGIGLLCGERSGGLEVLDFDHPDAYGQFYHLLSDNLKSIVDAMPLILTPSDGNHLYYRTEVLESGKVLSRVADGGVKIETRGQGNMIVAPGSPRETHSANRIYKMLRGNPLKPPTITIAQREGIFNFARQLNEFVSPPKPQTTTSTELRYFLSI